MSQREFSEEELRALEAEMEQITVDDVLLQTVVSLLNLGAARPGWVPRPARSPSATSSSSGWRSRARARCCRSSSRATPTSSAPCATRCRGCR